MDPAMLQNYLRRRAAALLEALFAPSRSTFRFNFGAAGRLADTEHHKLGRLNRRNSNSCDHQTHVNALGRVGFFVVLHKESFFRSFAHESAVTPEHGEK